MLNPPVLGRLHIHMPFQFMRIYSVHLCGGHNQSNETDLSSGKLGEQMDIVVALGCMPIPLPNICRLFLYSSCLFAWGRTSNISTNSTLVTFFLSIYCNVGVWNNMEFTLLWAQECWCWCVFLFVQRGAFIVIYATYAHRCLPKLLQQSTFYKHIF